LLGILLFDSGRLFAFRPKWIDLPIATWCIAKMGSSITNGFEIYDGLSAIEYTIIVWGLPWLFGRLYFSDIAGMRELAVGIALGGLIYVPLCLFEAKMSPQLQSWVYGMVRTDWAETKRFGGWRPTVFMQHGLMVGMWMSMTGLTAWWLWLTGAVKKLWRVPVLSATIAIVATAVICRSFGAIALMAVGMVVLWAARKFRRTSLLWILYAFVPLYMLLRLSGAWSGSNLVEFSNTIGGADRAGSLQSRLTSEDQFIRAGWQRPLFGFHGWYNTLQLQDKDSKVGIPDALWMIEFTGTGLVGMASLTLYLLLPVGRAWLQISRNHWNNPALMPVVGLGMIVLLSMIDNLFNAMLNPIFMLAAGALSGWVPVSLPTRQPIVARQNRVQRMRRPTVEGIKSLSK
jgi:hypothetical protein